MSSSLSLPPLALLPADDSSSSRAEFTCSSPHPTTEMLWETMAEQQRELHDEEVSTVCAKLRTAVALREMYRQPVELGEWGSGSGREVEPSDGSPDYHPFQQPQGTHGGGETRYVFEMRAGVVCVWEAQPGGGQSERAEEEAAAAARAVDDCAFETPPTYAKYARDLARLMRICADPAVNSFSWRRLNRLESRFHLHVRRGFPAGARRLGVPRCRASSAPTVLARTQRPAPSRPSGDGARAGRDDRAEEGAPPRLLQHPQGAAGGSRVEGSLSNALGNRVGQPCARASVWSLGSLPS